MILQSCPMGLVMIDAVDPAGILTVPSHELAPAAALTCKNHGWSGDETVVETLGLPLRLSLHVSNTRLVRMACVCVTPT